LGISVLSLTIATAPVTGPALGTAIAFAGIAYAYKGGLNVRKILKARKAQKKLKRNQRQKKNLKTLMKNKKAKK
jgi:hypothetical protein